MIDLNLISNQLMPLEEVASIIKPFNKNEKVIRNEFLIDFMDFFVPEFLDYTIQDVLYVDTAKYIDIKIKDSNQDVLITYSKESVWEHIYVKIDHVIEVTPEMIIKWMEEEKIKYPFVEDFVEYRKVIDIVAESKNRDESIIKSYYEDYLKFKTFAKSEGFAEENKDNRADTRLKLTANGKREQFALFVAVMTIKYKLWVEHGERKNAQASSFGKLFLGSDGGQFENNILSNALSKIKENEDLIIENGEQIVALYYNNKSVRDLIDEYKTTSKGRKNDKQPVKFE